MNANHPALHDHTNSNNIANVLGQAAFDAAYFLVDIMMYGVGMICMVYYAFCGMCQCMQRNLYRLTDKKNL